MAALTAWIFPFFLVILTGCASPPGLESPTGSGIETFQEGWYSVYFTTPDSPAAESLRGGPDAALADAINAARVSVDLAADDLDLWSVRDALISAHRRGVAVRVVVESENIGEPEVQDLIEAGVPVFGDAGGGLMHNKFAVVDRMEVWSGSMNLTINGAYRSNNNLVCIRSVELAEEYLMEFNEMFVGGRFGAGSPEGGRHPVISVDGARIEVYFSPDDGTLDRLLELVEGAQQSVYFLAYAFTDDDLADALIERAGEGVAVAGVVDAGQAKSNAGSDYETFLKHGLDIRLDGTPGSMHHKVIVIDEQFVVTGSYNFSQNARTRNDENTLVIHSEANAVLFLEEFQRIFSTAQRQ